MIQCGKDDMSIETNSNDGDDIPNLVNIDTTRLFYSDNKNENFDRLNGDDSSKQNDRQAICFLYASSLVATSLSIAAASLQRDNNDNKTLILKYGQPLFASCLYTISCLILLGMSIFFELHRRETFERVHAESGPVPFSIKFSMRGEKVNLYLRLGLAMFGMMSIGYVLAKFIETIQSNNPEPTDFVKSLLEMIFYVLQTLFILRYHRIVILRYNEAMGAGLVHVLTTNLCIWTDVSVDKIDKKLSYQKKLLHPYRHNSTSHLGFSCSWNSTSSATTPLSIKESGLAKTTDYLLPTVSEYCLLAAALLYEITLRIGQPSFIEVEKGNTGVNKRHRHPFLRECKSSSGSWFAIATVGCVVGISILQMASQSQACWKPIALLGQESILHAFGLGFVLAAAVKTRRLKFSIATRQSNLEEFLLYTASFFSANFIVSTIILAAVSAEQNLDSDDGMVRRKLLLCRCFLNAVELVQTLLQTYFIQDSFRRCSDRLEHQLVKPGRQAIVALLGINLALWILKSFQLKNADILFQLRDEIGSHGWVLFVVTMPISLFYRYHCTVCLSQCFNKLYEDETQRFEEMWRHRVDPLTDMASGLDYSFYAGSQAARKSTDSFLDYNRSDSVISNSHIGGNRHFSLLRRSLGTARMVKQWQTVDVVDEEEPTTNSPQTMISLPSITAPSTASPDDNNSPKRDASRCVSIESGMLDFSAAKRTSNSSNSSERTDSSNSHQKLNRFKCEKSKADSKPNKQKSDKKVSNFVDQIRNRLELPSLPGRHQRRSSGSYPNRDTDTNLFALAAMRLSVSMTFSNEKDAEFKSKLPLFASNATNHNHGRRESQSRRSTRKGSIVFPPIRRRRTLKNMEAAKYRVLAAELAHRMVIERGATAPTPAITSDGGGSRTLGPSSNLLAKPIELASRSMSLLPVGTQSFSNLRSKGSLRGLKPYSKMTEAVNETAALTIAPVETTLASTLQPSHAFTVTSGCLPKRRSISPLFASRFSSTINSSGNNGKECGENERTVTKNPSMKNLFNFTHKREKVNCTKGDKVPPHTSKLVGGDDVCQTPEITITENCD